MSQHDAAPKVPRRSWHPIEDKLLEVYAMYEPYTMPEGYSTIKRRLSLTRVKGEPGWTITSIPDWHRNTVWQIKLPPSTDPPFQLAEALYDAAK